MKLLFAVCTAYGFWLKCFRDILHYLFVNPFVPNAPFLYPLKTSENRKVFWCFQGVEKGCIENEWVKANFFSWRSSFLSSFFVLEWRKVAKLFLQFWCVHYFSLLSITSTLNNFTNKNQEIMKNLSLHYELPFEVVVTLPIYQNKLVSRQRISVI